MSEKIETFGNSLANKILVEKLEKEYDAKTFNKVSSFLNRINATYKQLNLLTDESIKKHIFNMLLHHCLHEAEQFPEDINSYIKNHIKTKHRTMIK